MPRNDRRRCGDSTDSPRRQNSVASGIPLIPRRIVRRIHPMGALAAMGGGSDVERLVLSRTTMVRLTLILHASSTRSVRDLLEALRFLGASVQLEAGCLGCSAWAEPDWSVRYVEEWQTEMDMRQRVRSDRFTSLLSVMESAEEPGVTFDFVSTRRGLDYVEEVRAGAGR